MMRAVEAKAATLYQRHASELASEDKQAVLSALEKLGAPLQELEGTQLIAPLTNLLGVFGDSKSFTLFVNGLVLEQLAATIYGRIAENAAISPEGRALARQAEKVSIATRDAAARGIASSVAVADVFDTFASETSEVLTRLDGLGEVIDATLGEAFDIRFADVLGDLTSELLPICIDLGMVRRKLIMHLTSAFMSAA
jgi:hypothetical protein